MNTKPILLSALATTLFVFSPTFRVLAQEDAKSKAPVVSAKPATNTVTAAESNKNADWFSFDGGNPDYLLNTIQRKYKVNWMAVADIPSSSHIVRVPHFRLSFAASSSIPSRVRDIVHLYNKMAQDKPELGKLVVEPEDKIMTPSIVMLVPNQANTFNSLQPKVKAFSLFGISDTNRDALLQGIHQAEYDAMRFSPSTNPRDVPGQIVMHKDTNLLIAIGTEPYLEMVESVVNAYQSAQSAKNPLASTPKPPQK